MRRVKVKSSFRNIQTIVERLMKFAMGTIREIG